MTMSIEDKFNQDVQWVLNELKTELLVANGNTVRFIFVVEDNVPTTREQKRILRWLMDLGAVEHISDIQQQTSIYTFHPFISAPTIGYKLSIDGTIFSELTKLYDGDLSKQSAKTLLSNARKLKSVQKVDTTQPAKAQDDNMPLFSKETREIIFAGKRCEIPVGNQFELAKILFSQPLGTWIKETDVVTQFTRGDNKQSFYDAQRGLNARIQKDLGIKDLLEYQTAMVRLNPETIRKLNQSEQ